MFTDWVCIFEVPVEYATQTMCVRVFVVTALLLHRMNATHIFGALECKPIERFIIHEKSLDSNNDSNNNNKARLCVKGI